MTIIQKHGHGEPQNLADYQFGWREADVDYHAEGYHGELYINDRNGGIQPVTAQVRADFKKALEDKAGEILAKVNQGKLQVKPTYKALGDYIEENASKIEVNDQFIVIHDESTTGHDDTVLYIVFDKDSDPDAVYDEAAKAVGDNKIAVPVTHLDFRFHDPKSIDGDNFNYSDFESENDYIEALQDMGYGITVGKPDEDGNTIDIQLTPKTRKFLNDLTNLGLVGDGASTDIFKEGFVNGITVAPNPIVGIEKNGVNVNSGVKISINKMIKTSTGWRPSTSDDEGTSIVLNLDDLVIDEGSW